MQEVTSSSLVSPTIIKSLLSIKMAGFCFLKNLRKKLKNGATGLLLANFGLYAGGMSFCGKGMAAAMGHQVARRIYLIYWAVILSRVAVIAYHIRWLGFL